MIDGGTIYAIVLICLVTFFVVRWLAHAAIDWWARRGLRREMREWSRRYGKGPHDD